MPLSILSDELPILLSCRLETAIILSKFDIRFTSFPEITCIMLKFEANIQDVHVNRKLAFIFLNGQSICFYELHFQVFYLKIVFVYF